MLRQKWQGWSTYGPEFQVGCEHQQNRGDDLPNMPRGSYVGLDSFREGHTEHQRTYLVVVLEELIQ